MEPNKFEEHIRTQLEEREIQPSAEAWASLEAQLGEAKGTNKTLWYAIAASLVAMLVVGSFLLKDNTTVSTEIVLETPQEAAETVNELTISEESKQEIATSNENEIEKNAVAEKLLPKKKQQKSRVAVAQVPQVKQKIEIPTSAVAKLEKDKEPVTVEKLLQKDFIDLKVDEVVARVQDLNTMNTNVSAEDIEVLLQKAQKDIATQRILEQATTKVDPASLLNDVETELERSFRDKVFDALGEGFNKVRTAVVERNN